VSVARSAIGLAQMSSAWNPSDTLTWVTAHS